MTKIAIYGTGAFGKIFFKALNEQIDYFIDDFSQDSEYKSIPICNISDIPKETKIYISPLQYSQKIEKKLTNLGFTNFLNFTSSVKVLPNILELVSQTNYLWLVNDKAKMLDINKIQKVKKFLKDQKSKDILSDIINLRTTLDTKYYIKPEGTEYFPEDIPVLENLDSVNFIDCGAYTGDTIEELVKQNFPIGYTLSFEPDDKNFTVLQNTLESLNLKNSFIFPAGVYSKNTILSFSNNGIDSSASLDDTSSLQVNVVALDTIIYNSSPNFIKMDIEGAEKEALLGAKQTIQRYKPNLAICLYHKPEDLWELPLLIQEIEPSYDMYIRVHEDLCLSTVLYCIARSS